MRKTPVASAALLAAFFSFTTPALADEPLRAGRDVIFLHPTTLLGAKQQYAAEFEVVAADDEREITPRILAYAPLAREVADYRAERRARGQAPLPLYVSLARGFHGTTYCVRQPFVLHAPDAAGDDVPRLRFAPVIHLAAGPLTAIRDGNEEQGLAVLCHEAGHAMMAVAYPAVSYPGSAAEGMLDLLTGEGHWYGKETDPLFAYSEGWAEFCQAFYTGRSLPKSLLETREGNGSEARVRPLGAAEIRKHEGAQAYLLLAVARGLGEESVVRQWLATMARSGPRTMNGLLVSYGRTHRERRAEIDRILRSASDGRFALDDDYGPADLLADQLGSWRRLGRAVVDRLQKLRTPESGR